jgi:hypothetical protein
MTAPIPPDQEPGFWCEYSAPATETARAVQYPTPASPWADRVINAYVADARIARRANRIAEGASA